jgi:glycosyltransferase involved in cell wall biosynthesis
MSASATADTRPLIVHLIDELPPDGAERLVVDILRYKNPHFRYAVGCLIRGGMLEAELTRMGVPVIVFGRRGRLDIGLIWRLARWMRRERVAIVHTHLFTADTYGRLAACLAGVPGIFSTVHNIVNPWKGFFRKFIDWALAWPSDKIIACTEEVGTVLRQRDHLPARRIAVIANGVDLRRFQAISASGVRAEFKVAPDQLLLAVVGRLHPQKGHADLLPILANLRKRSNAHFKCLFVGDGDLRGKLQARVTELGLSDVVVFTGLRSDVPRLLAGIDILVMPSRWEGLPIALLEAMACSKPAVATAVGGVPDVIQDCINGRLVNAGDAAALQQALLDMLESEADRRRLGERARIDVLERHDVARTASGYDTLYRRALQLGDQHALVISNSTGGS